MPAAGQARSVVGLDALNQLIPALTRRGYQVIGPTVRDGAIVYDTLRTLEDLPAGWTDEQEAGRYHLKKRDDRALFGYVVGPQSWKKFLHPPDVRLFEAQRDGATLRSLNNAAPPPRYAFLGVRACELAAIQVQDRVLIEDRFTDPIYQGRRRQIFIVAVNCTQSAPTCFCASMKTGPRASHSFDLALTEVIDKDRHQFVVEVGTPAGDDVLREIDRREAPHSLCRQADEAIDRAAV